MTTCSCCSHGSPVLAGRKFGGVARVGFRLQCFLGSSPDILENSDGHKWPYVSPGSRCSSFKQGKVTVAKDESGNYRAKCEVL